MSNYKELKNYKLLIHDYFNLSYRWDELNIAIDHFILSEGQEKSKNLLKEIRYMQKEAQWKEIEKINGEVGGIGYDEKRNKVFFERIIKYISERLKPNKYNKG